MTPPPSWLIPVLGALIGVALPLYAWRARGRQYGIFSAVVVLISFPTAVLLASRLEALLGPWVGWAFVYAFAAAGIHAMRLVDAKLRHRLYRYSISLPGMALQALGAIALPYFAALLPVRGLLWWAGAESALETLRWLDLLPVAVVAFSLVSSLTLRRETVRFALDAEGPAEFGRLPVERHRRAAPPLEERPLRIVQITDPHLGPWQPIHRLRRRLEELLDHEPDLILLTGDFLTMEGNGTPGCLTEALEPLQRVPGRCFACFGNHDHEAPEEVPRRDGRERSDVARRLGGDRRDAGWNGPDPGCGLSSRGPRGEARCTLTPSIRVSRIGFESCCCMTRSTSAMSPSGKPISRCPGHTHGGQVGLVSFGLDWTVLSRSRWPDHGLFGHGPSRLYVHRGTGFYGFPLRIGVPGEASLMELVLPSPR